MFPSPIPQVDLPETAGRENSNRLEVEERIDHHGITKADASLASEMEHALKKYSAFRASDFDNIKIRAEDGIVNLYGHVGSLSNQHRAEWAIQAIPGVLGVNNYLVPDDRLLSEVARSLAALEHRYGCKFFTGVFHGVVMVSGIVKEANVKLLAEKYASSNPNVRGVINGIHIEGTKEDSPEEPFLQPVIGEIFHFLDWISGVVKQVIISPDNRRVIAMTIHAQFSARWPGGKPLNYGEDVLVDRLVVVPMNAVRYMTQSSGFLNIHSSETKRFKDFDPNAYVVPHKDWLPPYPYSLQDVLFPVKYEHRDPQMADKSDPMELLEVSEDSTFKEQFFATNSPGV